MIPAPARTVGGGDWPRLGAYALVTKDPAWDQRCRGPLTCSPPVPEARARPGGMRAGMGKSDMRWPCDALGDGLSIEIRRGSGR
jgi:hypothetical protein